MNAAAVLGFARAAGKLASGEDECLRAIRYGRARLVLLAADAGPNTAKRVTRLAAEHRVECVRWGEKEKLGAWIGERPRAVVALLDGRFARMLKNAVESAEGRG